MNKKSVQEFLLYALVGGIATVSEWLFFFLLGLTQMHYTVATVIAYLLSTFINWLAGRLLVFKKTAIPFLKEITGVYLASLIGLLCNVLIMWIAIDMMTLPEMFSKIIATGIVFVYNFFVRKWFIYR